MKLYTNRYNKNSIIDKTEPDESVKKTPTQIMRHYIFNEDIFNGAGEKIRVFTEDDILKNQLHFLDGTPLNKVNKFSRKYISLCFCGCDYIC